LGVVVNARTTPIVDLPPAKEFLRTVVKSGLLDEEQVELALLDIPEAVHTDPSALADHLVASAKLTRFQADKLLQGIANGLALGPFHVLAPIGRGGMGIVYLARDTRSDLFVALKILPPKRAQSGSRRLARFQREMEMSQLVSHPHVAYTYEVGLSRGVYYLAMEYIPGDTLSRLVSRKGPLSVPRAARLFAEIASALDHAHTRGLVHRDLKPSNIMVTPHDHAKLLDLGLALMPEDRSAQVKRERQRRYVLGTMDYIAPEQAVDPMAVDARADLYSVGCTLYFALTGQQPFPGGTAKDKLRRHRLADPVPIPHLNPDVPAPFVGLVRRLMKKNPDQRVRSAAELHELLLPWAGSDTDQPLDRQSDREYLEAVAALEQAEVSPEMAAADLPMGILIESTTTNGEHDFRSDNLQIIQMDEVVAKPQIQKTSLKPLLAGLCFAAVLILWMVFWNQYH
jgi:serine/threonine protein kinase